MDKETKNTVELAVACCGVALLYLPWSCLLALMMRDESGSGANVFRLMELTGGALTAWAGWCAIAIGIIFLPLVLMPFVDKGPFMLPGTWNFYIVFSTWLFGFFTPYSYFMLKELMARRREFLPGAAALGR